MHETKGVRGHVFMVVVCSVIALAFLGLLYKMSGSTLPFVGTYELRAVLPAAGSLTQGSSVTMAGARVGSVLSVQKRGEGSVATLKIDDTSVTPVPKDSEVRLRVRTPLGENYVEIAPGKSHATLSSGGLLTRQSPHQYVDVDQILSTLQGGTRERARKLIEGLGHGVRHRGEDLNATIHGASDVLESGSAITHTLVGDRRQAAQLVRQLGDVASALAERQASIRQMAHQGLVAFRAVAARDDSVRRLLAELPSTLAQVRTTTRTLGQTSDAASPVVTNLAAAVREIRPAVVNLKPAAEQGQGIVRELDTAAPRLRGTLRSVTNAAPRLAKVLPRTRKVLCQVDPALRYLKPYTRDVIGLVGGLSSDSNAYDAVGHTIRLLPILGEGSLAGLPDNVSQAASTLAHSGVLQSEQGLSYDPFPKPYQAGRSVGKNEHIGGPDQLAKSGYKYPRIHADC